MYRTTLWWIMVAVWLTSWLFLRNCSRMLILTRFVERTSAGHSVMQVIKVASKDPISREMKKMTCHVISLVYQVHLAPVQDYMIPIGCYQNQQKTSIYIYIPMSASGSVLPYSSNHSHNHSMSRSKCTYFLPAILDYRSGV